MINISIKEYLGVVYNGLALSLVLNINDKVYELYYWFDENIFELRTDENFLYDMKIKTIEEYSSYNKLIKFIDETIDKDKLIKEILLDTDKKKYYELLYIDNTLSNLENLIKTL